MTGVTFRVAPAFVACRQYMDRRRQPRVNALLPVRIWGVDANCLPFMQLVTAMTISENGALLEGVRCPLRPGEVVDVQYNRMKAESVVVWAGTPGPHHEGAIGLETLPAHPRTWADYPYRPCHSAGHRHPAP